MSCNKCYEDFICRCIPYEDVLTINTALPEDAAGYNYRLTDKTGAVYEGETVWHPQSLEIPVVGFPDGFFTEFSGGFKLELFKDGYCTRVGIPLIKEYDCIEFSVVAGTSQKDSIGCQYPECEPVP